MWAVVPESCRSAPASEGWTLGSDECFQLLEQSVTWRGKQRASKSWQRAWKKDLWIQHLCGRISKVLTAQIGVEQWISSLRDTPASPSATPANEKAQTTLGTSGLTLRESSGKPSQGLLFSKTCKDTSPKGSEKSSRRLPNWGSMQSGVYTAQLKPAFPTAGTGSSSWPTAVAGDSKSCRAAGYSTESGRHSGTTLTDACRQWPTPQTRDFPSPDLKGSGNYERKVSKGYTIDLNSRVVNWATPTAQLYCDAESAESFQARAARWKAEKGYHNSVPLTVQAKNSGPLAPRTTGAMFPSTSGLRLNPIFVESLMGFPIGWTAFAPLATQSFPSKQN